MEITIAPQSSHRYGQHQNCDVKANIQRRPSVPQMRYGPWRAKVTTLGGEIFYLNNVVSRETTCALKIRLIKGGPL